MIDVDANSPLLALRLGSNQPANVRAPRGTVESSPCRGILVPDGELGALRASAQEVIQLPSLSVLQFLFYRQMVLEQSGLSSCVKTVVPSTDG